MKLAWRMEWITASNLSRISKFDQDLDSCNIGSTAAFAMPCPVMKAHSHGDSADCRCYRLIITAIQHAVCPHTSNDTATAAPFSIQSYRDTANYVIVIECNRTVVPRDTVVASLYLRQSPNSKLIQDKQWHVLPFQTSIVQVEVYGLESTKFNVGTIPWMYTTKANTVEKFSELPHKTFRVLLSTCHYRKLFAM